MKSKIDLLIKPSLASIIIPFLISILCWSLSYFVPNNIVEKTIESPIENWIQTYISSQNALSLSLGWFFTWVIAVLLIFLNTRFAFIPSRTMLPAFFYVMLISCSAQMHHFSVAQVGSFLTISALCELFSMYQKTDIKKAFNIGIILCLCVFLSVDFIWVIPLSWIAMQRLNTLNLNTFLANIFGIIVPITLIYGYAFIFDINLSPIENYYNQLRFEAPSFEFDFTLQFFLLTLAVITIIVIYNILNRSFFDKIQSSRTLGTFAFFFLFSVILFLCNLECQATYHLLGFIFSSLLISYYFTINQTVFSKILFYLLSLSSIAYFLDTIIFKY